MMNNLVSRQYLLDEYDRRHKGPPGGARKIIEDAPAVDAISKQEVLKIMKRHLEKTDIPLSYPGLLNAIRLWLDDAPAVKDC